LEQKFDPIERFGRHIPFVDYFDCDERDCRAEAGMNLLPDASDQYRHDFPFLLEQKFDPIERFGRHIPFVDDFDCDERDCRAGAGMNLLPDASGQYRHDFPFLLQQKFDPIERFGRHIPFVDYFDCDGRDYWAEAPQSTILSTDSDVQLPFEDLYHRPDSYPLIDQDPFQPKRIVQPAGVASPEFVTERVKLNPQQVIYIFQQRIKKKCHTAKLLSEHFGVTQKAIRDIWKGRSWGSDTKPYQTLVESDLVLTKS